MSLDPLGLEVQELRTLAGSHRPDSVEIQDATTVADGKGGWEKTWVTGSTVSGRLRAAGTLASERSEMTQRKIVEAWVIALPYSVTVTPLQRLKVGTRIFDVVSINTERSYQVETRVMCTEVKA